MLYMMRFLMCVSVSSPSTRWATLLYKAAPLVLSVHMCVLSIWIRCIMNVWVTRTHTGRVTEQMNRSQLYGAAAAAAEPRHGSSRRCDMITNKAGEQNRAFFFFMKSSKCFLYLTPVKQLEHFKPAEGRELCYELIVPKPVFVLNTGN